MIDCTLTMTAAIPGLLDGLAAFWGKVAQEFVDNPYILGYEIINEPWAGEVKKGTKGEGLLYLSLSFV